MPSGSLSNITLPVEDGVGNKEACDGGKWSPCYNTQYWETPLEFSNTTGTQYDDHVKCHSLFSTEIFLIVGMKIFCKHDVHAYMDHKYSVKLIMHCSTLRAC